jgi:ubiquinone biosynthesis protein COQ4
MSASSSSVTATSAGGEAARLSGNRFPRNRMRPLRAARALRELAKSHGKDLPQGVAFLRATEGNAGRRAFERFRGTPFGREVLERRLALCDQLIVRDALAAMQAGSLGRAYLDFMERENISLTGLLDLASSDPYPRMSEEELLFAERCHVMHDLWHVVTGYGQDDAGEVCILALRAAQMRHLGVWLLCLAGTIKVARAFGHRAARAAVREAFNRSRRAVWLYGVNWEAMLPEPLEVVRQQLRLTPAAHYPVPTAQ